MTLTPACAYLRMSRDIQDTSIEIQEPALYKLAADYGYEIIQSYKDLGCSGSRETEKRTDWLRLLADAPTARWKVILCYNRSRFSRLDSIEEGFAKQTLREAGKKLHTAQEGMMDWETMAGRIMDAILTDSSNQYAATIGLNTLAGKLNAFLKGKAFGLKCSYGMARRLTDLDGKLHEISRKKTFTKPKNWEQMFVPGEVQEVETVQWLFQEFNSQDIGFHCLAIELNAKGIPAADGGMWSAMLVRRVLMNQVYVGDVMLGKLACGKFARLNGEQVVKNTEGKKRVPKEGLILRDVHEGIISRKLWNEVQDKLKRRARHGEKSGGRNGYPLKGVLVCGHCNCYMYGQKKKRAKSDLITYVCKRHLEYGDSSGCAQWSIPQRDILPVVIDRLTSEIDMRILAQSSVQPPQPKSRDPQGVVVNLERKLAELDRKLKRGTERFLSTEDLSLAPRLKAQLSEWQVERDLVARELEQACRGVPQLATELEEWQRWFAARKDELVEVQASPSEGVQLKEGVTFSAAGMREVLHRYGCRVTCWWTPRGDGHYDVEKVRIQLGCAEKPPAKPITRPLARKKPRSEAAEVVTQKSLCVTYSATFIDRTFSAEELWPDRYEYKLTAILPEVQKMHAGGANMPQIAAYLNAKGIKSPRGRSWDKNKVLFAFFRKQEKT
jgi:DNA invertase Pin-like site-specific DNA recombinase